MGGEEYKKITKFTDLKAWLEGHRLVLLIYKITNLFPEEEKYGLVDQMRRASVSITSNIAEGFSRQSEKEKVQFYKHSTGSLTELQNQLLIAKDIKYIKEIEFNEIAQQSVIVHKLLNGLIRATREKRYEKVV